MLWLRSVLPILKGYPGCLLITAGTVAAHSFGGWAKPRCWCFCLETWGSEKVEWFQRWLSSLYVCSEWSDSWCGNLNFPKLLTSLLTRAQSIQNICAHILLKEKFDDVSQYYKTFEWKANHGSDLTKHYYQRSFRAATFEVAFEKLALATALNFFDWIKITVGKKWADYFTVILIFNFKFNLIFTM